MTTLTATNTTLQKCGHKHEAIMQWLLEHPEEKLIVCATEFKVTQTWLSIVIHSHTFQDSFAKYREDYYSGIATGLEEKLTGLAHLAVDRLSEKMETCDDAAWIAATSDKIFGRLGFGSRNTGVTINTPNGANIQVVQASSAALEAAESARRRLQRLKDMENPIIEGEVEEAAIAQTKRV